MKNARKVSKAATNVRKGKKIFKNFPWRLRKVEKGCTFASAFEGILND
jgi:hypothetical protein